MKALRVSVSKSSQSLRYIWGGRALKILARFIPITWREGAAFSIYSLLVGSSQSSLDLLWFSYRPTSAASFSYPLEVTTKGSDIQVEKL